MIGKNRPFPLVVSLLILAAVMLPQPAYACGSCVYGAMALLFPPLSTWIILFAIWLAVVLILKVFTVTLTGKEVIHGLLWGGVSVVGGAMILGPLPFVILFVYWLCWYMKLINEAIARTITRVDKILLFTNHALVIALIIVTVVIYSEAAAGGIRYRMKHLVKYNYEYSLAKEIVSKELLIDRELIDIAQNGDNSQRKVAICAMEKSKDERFVPIIIEIMQMEKDRDVVRQMCVSLDELTGQKVEGTPAAWKKWWGMNKGTWYSNNSRQP